MGHHRLKTLAFFRKLYFQLLYDLHLDSTLGCAPVIEGMFTV